MTPYDYAVLCQRSYADAPTLGAPDSASVVHVYDTRIGPVHCFRGTDDIDGWRHDIDVTTVTVPRLGVLHRGFYNAFAALLPALSALPNPVAITGHSLGGAMAVLWGATLALRNLAVPVLAFEAPRVAHDGVLQVLLDSARVSVYATRNGNDLVPLIPVGFTFPAHVVKIGTALLPVPNVEDHSIARVVAALAPAG